jgi:xylulokinase
MLEQAPEDWWKATCTTINQLMKTSGVSPAGVMAIGCGGQFPDLVVMDCDGRTLRPAIIYSDMRGEQQTKEIFDRLGREQVTEVTGLPATYFPGLPASKILWIREHEPEVEKRIGRILGAKDFLNFRLTGNCAIDYVEAWWTGLVRARDYSWSDEMLQSLRIPRGWLGEMNRPTDVIGEVTEAASKQTGLVPGTRVVCGSVDGMCDVVGAGIIEPGITMDACGTTEIIAASSMKRLPPSIGNSIFCWPHLDGERWVVYTSTATAGASLRWFSDQFAATEKAEAFGEGVSVYDILNRQAEAVEAGSGGLLFWPYLAGEYTPFFDLNARGAFLGISLDKGKGHFVRAILEGVAFSLNHVIEAFTELGLETRKVRTAGGGSRSRVWNQIKADVTGRPVQLTKVNELGCLGSAVLAGIGVGAFSNLEEASRSAVSITQEFASNTENHRIYSKLFSVYKENCSRIRDIFTSLSSA